MAECSSLFQLRAVFGRFKANVAEEFTRANAVKVANSFQLSPLKCDAIQTADNPGLTLMTILENEEYIGPHFGVDRLVDALKELDMGGIADIASEYYEEKSINRVDTADGHVYIQKGLLTPCLRDELTQQNCYELAVYLGLSKKICEDIRQTPMPTEELLKQLIDNLVITDAGDIIDVKTFTSALKERGLGRVATLVLCATPAEDLERRESQVTGSKAFDERDTLNDALRNELSPQNCYDIAMYFGLSPKMCDGLKVSQTPSADLLQHLHDGGFVSDANVGVFCLVLKALNLEKAARALQTSAAGKFGNMEEPEKEPDVVLLKCIDKWICDSEDFGEFPSPDNELVFLQCKQCSTEWISERSSPGNSILSLRRGGQRFQYKPPIYCGSNSRRREEIREARELRPGDHIAIGGLYHHSTIVVSIDEPRVEVIHWTRNKQQGLMKSIITKKVATAYHIQREVIDLPDSNVWRVVYEKEDPSSVVIARAMKMMEKPDQTYCIFDNNCETLATYCKLGRGFSQVGEMLSESLPPVMTWFVKSLH